MYVKDLELYICFCLCIYCLLDVISTIFFQAIDIWMGACTAFIFAALLEFTLTNYLWRQGRKGNSTSSRKIRRSSERVETLEKVYMVKSWSR
jgi:hypothetical protein